VSFTFRLVFGDENPGANPPRNRADVARVQMNRWRVSATGARSGPSLGRKALSTFQCRLAVSAQPNPEPVSILGLETILANYNLATLHTSISGRLSSGFRLFKGFKLAPLGLRRLRKSLRALLSGFVT
jgi:hypothetical protein